MTARESGTSYNKAAKQAIDMPGMTMTGLPHKDYQKGQKLQREWEWENNTSKVQGQTEQDTYWTHQTNPQTFDVKK